MWALFGLCQRLFVDGRSATDKDATAQSSAAQTRALKTNVRLMRLLACIIAAAVYVWQEQREFSFSGIQFNAFILGICVLSFSLCLFVRGPSRIQPPESVARILRFIGRHTLEIYAIQLAGSELIIKLLPDLAA